MFPKVDEREQPLTAARDAEVLFDEFKKRMHEWEDTVYSVWGLEQAPETGRWHFQGFFKLKTRQRMMTVKASFPTSKYWGAPHLEAAKGSDKQNFDYCTKVDAGKEYSPKWFESGTRPSFETAGRREKRRWDEARKCALEGRINEISDDHIYVTQFSNLEKIRDRNHTAVALEAHGEELKNHFTWIYGPPGSGKTRAFYDYCKKEGKSYYLKHCLNHWWDGYTDQDAVLMDDFPKEGSQHMLFRLKQWLQEPPFPAETKGGHREIRPPEIVITSNYHFEEIFADADPREIEALRRRMEVIHMGPPETAYRRASSASSAPGFVLKKDAPAKRSRLAPKAPAMPALISVDAPITQDTTQSLDEYGNEEEDYT